LQCRSYVLQYECFVGERIAVRYRLETLYFMLADFFALYLQQSPLLVNVGRPSLLERAIAEHIANYTHIKCLGICY